jgi:hypothetical protein
MIIITFILIIVLKPIPAGRPGTRLARVEEKIEEGKTQRDPATRLTRSKTQLRPVDFCFFTKTMSFWFLKKIDPNDPGLGRGRVWKLWSLYWPSWPSWFVTWVLYQVDLGLRFLNYDNNNFYFYVDSSQIGLTLLPHDLGFALSQNMIRDFKTMIIIIFVTVLTRFDN